jgi:hypothetical protein
MVVLKVLLLFDGCDGAGKTFLARKIATSLGRETVDLDDHLEHDTRVFFGALRLPEVSKSIAARAGIFLRRLCVGGLHAKGARGNQSVRIHQCICPAKHRHELAG